MMARVELVLLALLTAPSHALSFGTSRRAVIQGTASAATLAALPRAAHAGTRSIAKKKAENAAAAKCYGPNYAEVPCGSIVESVTDAPTVDAKTANELDINNFIAADFKTFPGLYPTIAGKLMNARTRQRTSGEFQSKQAMYDSLESDTEVAALKRYDQNIVIRPIDAKLMQFKVATGTVGSQGGG